MRNVLFLCAFLAVAALAALFIFRVSATSMLTIGVFLLCPLMHFLMMRGDKHHH